VTRPKLEEVAKHQFESDNKLGRHGTGAIPDSPDPRDYEYAAVAAASRFMQLPESVSLADNLPKKIWDQKAFSSCTSYTAHHLVAAARNKAEMPYLEPSFMATWYWSKAASYGPSIAGQDIGCSIREAVLSTRREGVAPASLFPYTEQNLTKEPPAEVVSAAEASQSLYFFRVDDYEKGIDVEFLYRCLAEGWPVSIALPLYDTFNPEYGSGFVPYPTDKAKFVGWHAMTLYGYYLRGRRPYFRCRNQWGSSWGGRYLTPSGKRVESGTCRLPIEYVRDMGYDCWTIRAVENDRIQGVPIERVIP
jgi:hypothetical protein